MEYRRRQYLHLLLQVILLTANCLAENLTLTVNFKRRICVTDNAFLSLTLDPATLTSTTDVLIKNIERYTNMVRGLAPAYVRFGGPGSNSYDGVDVDPNGMLFETHSILIHRWAEDAGLDIIACISPSYVADKSGTYSWESTNLAQLLSFNDRMGHNASWQLGYECQTRCDLSGGNLGRYVANLRETLKTYPRYSDSLITGPDIVEYRTARQREYLRDYLSTAGDALSAITWHPDFASVTVNGNDISVHPDNIAAEKDELYKVIGHIAGDKPLWIAESKPEECKHKYMGALTWTRRLGNAAKLGVQVVMRQFLEFSRATPDYWVSLLHKALVGPEVLEAKIQSDDESHAHFYSQCTRPSALYEKGALTIFGVNLMPREMTVGLKDFKIKTLHKYILSPDMSATGNKMFAENVLLNGKLLGLMDGMKLPDLNPDIDTNPDGLRLKLAPGNIGFWVIPNAKVKACTHEEEETTEDIAAKKLSKRHANVIRQINKEEAQEEENINPSNLENQELHAEQETTKRRNDRTDVRRKILKAKLYRRIKRLLPKRIQQQKENDEIANLQRPFTIIFARERNNSPEQTERQHNLDNGHFEETEKSDDKAEINQEDIQDTLKRYKHGLLKRKTRTEAEHFFRPKMRDVNKAAELISKIEALLQHEKEVTNRKRYRRDLNKRSEDPRKDVLVRHSRTDDLKDRIKRKMRRRIDDRKETSLITSDLRNFDDSKSNLHGLLRRPLRRFLRGNGHRGDPQHSASSIQEHGRATRDVNRILTEIGPGRHAILRKRSRIVDVRDHMNERKSKRKDDFKREGLLSSLNPRITDSGESGFYGFLRRDPIRGFPEGDVFVTIGDSGEQSSQDYDYVEEDEDDSRRKDDQQHEPESTVDDVSWMKIDDDQRDYTPNEFFEIVNLRSAKIFEGAKNYDDLCEAEFVLGEQENNEDNDNGSTVAGIAQLDEGDKRVQERSMQQPMNYHGNPEEEEYNQDVNYEAPGSHSGPSTPLHQLTEIPRNTKYDFTNYRASDASIEVTKQKLESEPGFSSFFYQPALVSPAKHDYNNFQATNVKPDFEYIAHPNNDRVVVYHRRDKRSDTKELQGLFSEEMIKEDANNTKDCQCRVTRAPKKEAADAEAEASPDFARPSRNMPRPIMKEKFDRIMTGEMLSSTSETDSDYDKRDAETVTVGSNRSHRRFTEAMRTMDEAKSSATPASGTSDLSAQRITEEQTFFRAQSSTAPTEIEEATYDPEAALEVPSRNKENRQQLATSEATRQTSTYLYEETQFKEGTRQKLTDAVTKGEKAKRKRSDDREGSSKPEEEMTKRIAEESTTETSKLGAHKTTDSKANRSKSRKLPKESGQDEDGPSPSEKCEDRARAKEKNDLKRVTSQIQNMPKSRLRDIVRYEEYLVRRAEQARKLKERLKARRERRRNDPARIAEEQTRNLRRREVWEKFCENDDFCRLFDQGKPLRFLKDEVEARVDVDDDDNDGDYDVKHEEDGLVNSHYRFLRHPKVIGIEREPATSSTPSSRRIFAMDPSTYHGDEPVLELHKEYLDLPPPKYSSKTKSETQAPKWTLKDFYQTLPKVYGNQQSTSKPYDNYYRRDYARKSQVKDAHERGNAVVLYVLDKHRQYDTAEELADSLSRIYLSALNRRDINRAAKGETTSDLNRFGDSASALKTARKVSLSKKINEEDTGTERYAQHEEVDSRYDENVGEENNRSNEMNDEVEDDTDVSNTKARNVEEEIVDGGGSEASGLLDTSNISPRSRRNTEEQTADKHLQRTRLSRADAKTESDRNRYICMEEEDSEEISSEQSIPLYQLTRLSSDAVLSRKSKNYATSSNRNSDQEEERQGEERSPRYVILMPDKIKDVRSYETLGAKNPERFSERFGVSSWLDRYLPRRITNAMIRYLNDVSSDEPDYEDPLDLPSGSAEETSDEDISYSSDYSGVSSESRRKVPRNVADEVDHESKEEDQQKTKRQRRQAEIDTLETSESVLTEGAAKNENDKYYLQRNSMNEKGTTKTDHLHSEKDGKIYGDFLEDLVKSQKKYIISTEDKGNNESLENGITKSDKKLPSFMEETIPKLQGVIIDGLEKAKDLTDSVEQFVNNFEENFNETSVADEETSSTNKISESTDNPFHLAIMNIKKLFTLFTGILHA
ncbi:PREDICTED: uncharacterized protein LOC106741036 [Dinoponera quadriceps]|uniref:Uncharacterized protein LOC106741036 n=1 Tax=Dinoponera quadriceps TaxID=609295 RepID=A0A6P3WPL5_DINQU|nr:PREDICTED: uncharacterized protein LOC106741036 [Dinoponera quadriceps]